MARIGSVSLSGIWMSALLFVGTYATPFFDCGSTATLTSVRLQNCDELPCQIPRETNMTLEVDFTSVADTGEIYGLVLVELGGSFADVPGFEDPCKFLVVGDCPLAADESLTYSVTFPTEKLWPPVSTYAYFGILSKANDDIIVCFSFPIVIV